MRGTTGAGSVTVLIPAHNEAASIADTLQSLYAQTRVPDQIIVVDDCSMDGTGEIARAMGARVVRTPNNTGAKAGAQNFGLALVDTELVLSIDADTTLAPDALERLLPSFDTPQVASACGFVLPRHVRTLWERGRYIEYLFAFSFHRQIQDFYGRPLLASGCFAMSRVSKLRELGGWTLTTLAEDMDLTWRLYEAGYAVRFVPESVSHPIEPPTLHYLQKQLRRWSHGFVQCVRLHWRDLLEVRYLRSVVAVTIWDAVFSSILFIFVLPVLAVALAKPWLLLGYFVDIPALLIPLLVGAIPRREVGRMLASLPAFFVVRTVNAVFFLGAIWSEWIMRRPLSVFEKGH